MDWLRQMLGLPEEFVGVIQDTASTATLVALLSARERATGGAAGRRGMDAGPGLTVYASREAHSSVDKGVKLAGYGLDRLRRIPGDAAFALDPAALERAIQEDVAAGLKPACVVATIGTTSSTAVDPVPAIAAICRRHGIWLHVDAAYAGAAAIVPELRGILRGHGVGRQHRPQSPQVAADQLRLHRLLRARPRRAALDLQRHAGVPAHRARRRGGELPRLGDSARPAVSRAQALVRDPELRRRGPAARSSGGMSRSRRSSPAGWTEAPDFERVAPVPFGLVCFRYRPAGKSEQELDGLNERCWRTVNATRRVCLTHTRLGGRYVDPDGDRPAGDRAGAR